MARLIPAVFLLMSCQPTETSSKAAMAPAITPEISAQANSALSNWLECEECEEGQLQKVLDHASLLEPMLIESVQYGASPASKAVYQYMLEQKYNEMESYALQHPELAPRLSRDGWVNLYLARLDDRYRIRSAQALAIMGGEPAKAAISRALASADSETARSGLRQALASMD